MSGSLRKSAVLSNCAEKKSSSLEGTHL